MGKFMDFKTVILRKLYRLRVIGGKHTAVENLTKGLPSHAVGKAKEAVEHLIKEGLLIKKPTSYGLQVSLNHKRISEISKLLGAENSDG